MEELLKELDEIKQKMAEIEKKIEEKQEKEKNDRWKPEKGDTYWLIGGEGNIYNSRWDNDGLDKGRYLIGNCYRTKEECEFAKEKLKVIVELKEFAEPKDSVWDEGYAHYYILLDYNTFNIDIDYTYALRQNDIYFASRDNALKAINAVGEERIKKYYFEVEE